MQSSNETGRRLFEAAQIGSLTLKNRLVRSATWENMADEKGHITEGLFGVYEDLARGGTGMIITGYAFVLGEEQPNPGMMGIYDDSFVPEYRRLTDRVHALGSRIVMQIVYGGSCAGYPAAGRVIWSPSGVADLATGIVPVPMEKEDIRRLVKAFGDAARRVRDAGFDGVQIHGAHGYLLSQFLTPYYNRRTDEYGGSLENRARIVLEVYDEIRRRVGKEFPVMIKINSEDFIEGGVSAEESLAVSVMLDERGIDAIEVSGGVASAGERIPPRVRIDSSEKEAYHATHASRIADHVSSPVIVVGGLRSPGVIEELLDTTRIGFFSLSRPLLCEPALPLRWQGGDRSEARCVSCNGCLRRAEGGNRCILKKIPR
jgi:2,4-dienoyl-CoA reductase-like NADH-dependent reductase (Old Yellow Enzyme family)